MFSLILVVILVQVPSPDASKIFMFPWPDSFSHVKTLDKIGVELQLRGHQVVLLLSDMEVHRDKVQSDYRIYNTSYPRGFLIQTMVPTLIRLGYSPPDLEAIQTSLKTCDIMTNACDALLSNSDLLDSLKDADLLLNDNFYPCGSLLGEKLSLLRVDVAPLGFLDAVIAETYKIPTPLSYLPILPWFSSKMSFLARTLNYAGAVALRLLADNLCTNPSFNGLMKKHRIAPEKTFQDIAADVDLLLVPVDWAVEWPRPILPGVKVVGMIGPEPSSVLPTDLEEFVNGAEHGVIVVSFGSITPKYLDLKLVDVIVRALSALPQKVLWSNIGNYTLPAESNIKSLKWLPQNDLLAHPNTKLFVSHCGMGGLNGAVYHGVPILAVPICFDQYLLAMKVVSAGMAIVVDVKTELDDTKRLRDSARELLHNPSYSQHAKRVSRLAKDRLRTPVEESADWVEFVLRANGTKHLQPEAVNMSWFKHDLLDVKIFLLASLCLLVLFVCKVCQCVWTGCKRCCGAAQNKQKTS